MENFREVVDLPAGTPLKTEKKLRLKNVTFDLKLDLFEDYTTIIGFKLLKPD